MIKKTQKGKDQFDQFGTICLTLKQLVDGEKASYCDLFALFIEEMSSSDLTAASKPAS